MSIFHNNALLNAAGNQGGGYEITRSLRFNDDDSAYLSRTPGSAGNRRTWTVSLWMKLGNIGTNNKHIFETTNNPEYTGLYTTTDGRLEFRGYTTGFTWRLTSSQRLRDPSAWYHVVVNFDSTKSDDRLEMYINGSQVTNYESLSQPDPNHQTAWNNNVTQYIGTFNTSANHWDGYLAEIHSVDGQALDASNFGEYDDNGIWNPIAYSGSYGTNGFYLDFSDNSSTSALGTDAAGSNDWTPNNLLASTYTGTVQYGEDTSNTNFDSSATSLTYNTTGFSYSTQTSPLTDTGDANASTVLKTSDGTAIDWTFSTDSTDRYIWTSSNGTNWSSKGSYYDTDASPQTVNAAWVAWAGGANSSTLTVTWGDPNPVDSVIDSPTNYTASGNNGGNYCTLNPLTKDGGTLSQGNLRYDLGSGTKRVEGTMSVKSGLWYWEAKAVSGTTNGTVGGRFGITIQTSVDNPEQGPYNLSWHATVGVQKYVEGSSTTMSAAGTQYSDGDVLGLALDADNNIAYFYKNGTLAHTVDFSSDVTAGSQFLTPVCWNGSSGTPVWWYNFGQRGFDYTPRTNHVSLCTANFEDPDIAKGNDYFEAKTYSGTGSSQSITGLAFAPDLVWIKNRTTSDTHAILDIIRGTNTVLSSNLSNGDRTESGSLTAFNSDGFTVGSYNDTNRSSNNFVALNWKAGSSNVSNTSGSINSTVRANTTSGFSIVSYTSDGSNGNRTVGHGLGKYPEFIIVKNRDDSRDWSVWFDALDNTDMSLVLNSDSQSASLAWVGVPNTTTFQVRGGYQNKASNDMIAYLWNSVEGFSSFGRYDGNNSSNGAFVYTGFRPRWLLVKIENQSDHWVMWDSARGDATYNGNVNDLPLFPNLSNNESANSSRSVDLLSNGFKLRGTDNSVNGSYDYVYAAFAEHPFKTARAK